MSRKLDVNNPQDIVEFRKARGWSRVELARKLCNTPVASLKNWETGRSCPPPYLRLALLHLARRHKPIHAPAEVTEFEFRL